MGFPESNSKVTIIIAELKLSKEKNYCGDIEV